MRLPLLAAAALTLAFGAAPLHAHEAGPVLPAPTQGVIGEAHLTPEFWIGRLPQPDRVVLDSTAIAVQNARLVHLDPSMHDLRAMAGTWPRAQVASWIESPDRGTTARSPARCGRALGRCDY